MLITVERVEGINQEYCVSSLLLETLLDCMNGCFCPCNLTSTELNRACSIQDVISSHRYGCLGNDATRALLHIYSILVIILRCPLVQEISRSSKVDRHHITRDRESAVLADVYGLSITLAQSLAYVQCRCWRQFNVG